MNKTTRRAAAKTVLKKTAKAKPRPRKASPKQPVVLTLADSLADLAGTPRPDHPGV